MAATPFSNRYKNPQQFQNPGDYLDPKIKQGKTGNVDIQKEWYLKKCQWIYSCYLRDDAYIPYSSTRDFQTNRLYAQGRQPVNKYMNMFTIPDKKTGQRKGFMNISWDIFSPMTKLRSIVLGKFEDIDYNILIRAVDDASNTTREDAKLTIMVESKYNELLEGFRQRIGGDSGPEVKDAKIPYIPKSIDEFDMMQQLGAFKLAWEVSMDKLCNDTGMKVNWPELKRRLLEDAIDLGLIAVKDYQDPQTNLPMLRYVDPQNFIIRQTRRNDFHDVTEAGEICWYTLEQLRTYGFTDQELSQMGATYGGQFGNTYASTPSSVWSNYNNGLDGIRAGVLDVEFQSFDTEFFEMRNGVSENGAGYNLAVELPFDSSGPTNKKNRFVKKDKPKFYRAKWVIGTDFIFDYGLQYDVPYHQKSTPKSSYSCYRVSDRSMVNQCIAVLDDFQIGVLKLRNAEANSRPAGIQIEWGSITNITHGGDEMSPWEIIKLFNDKGDLLYRHAVDPNNGRQIQGGIPPIVPLTGGIGPYMGELLQGLEWKMNNLREITGINAIVDSSAPAPGALVGTAKIAEAATNHVLRPILSGYKSVKQRAFGNVCNRWQIVAMHYPQAITTTIGNAAFETIKVGSELYEPIFDVFCDAIISDDDKMKIENAMLQSMAAAKTGMVGITMMDYFYITQLVQAGNIRYAWVYLSYREQQAKKEQDVRVATTQKQVGEQSMDLQKQKDDQAVNLIVVSEQEKRKTLLLEHQFKMQELQMQAKQKATAPAN